MSRRCFTNRWRSACAVALLLGLSVGCRTTTEDVERWANTQQGPTKLVAVLTHDKYDLDLREKAALTLVSMRPRGGQSIGIDAFIQALTQMAPAERARVVAEVVPDLAQRLEQPPTTGETDPTVAYKDAAYALLTTEEAQLVDDPALQKQLRDALTTWAMADFSRRMDAPQQKVGMQQLLRSLGADSVKGLPALIKPGEPKIDRIVQLIAEIGDAETKAAVSDNLVAVAKQVASEAWLQEKKPQLEKANQESGLQVDEKRFAQQLKAYQEEELIRVFSSMKRIGGAPVVDYLLSFATDAERPEKQRAAALAALERNIDKNNKEQIARVLKIAGAEATPDAVRDQALRRAGELPREMVIQELYGLFDHSNWKVRWLAAELVLQMSEASHVPEFMAQLAKVKHMSLSEPLRYGKLLGELKGASADTLKPYLSSTHSPAVRVSALGHYYDAGTKADLAMVEPYASDREKVPACAKEAKDCEWECAGQNIGTIGEYVTHCIKPAMQAREQAPAAETAKTP